MNSSGRVWQLAGAALLVALTTAAYVPSLGGSFLVDDDVLVADSPLIRAPDGLYRFWLTSEPLDYWPVTNSTFWLEWRAWGTDARGYRIANLVLHLIESLLLWSLLRRLAIPGAFLAALLFAVHPINVESVAWIAQRKNLLALLFMLLAARAYLEPELPRSQTIPSPVAISGDEGGSGWGLAIFLAALAMLSKVSAIVLPPLLLLLVWWRRPLRRRDLARSAPLFVLAAGLAAVNLWFRASKLEIAADTAPFGERLLAAAAAIWFYLGKALLPIGLAFVYPRWQVQADQVRWWLPLLAAVATTIVLWCYRNSRARPVFVAWLYVCIALAPGLGLTEPLVVADYYLHVALIGVLALVAAGWAAWRRRAARLRPLADAAAVIAVVALAALTWRQSALYSDSATLFVAAADQYPDSASAQHNAGFALLRAGRLDEARARLERALAIAPDSVDVHKTLGATLLRAGAADAAIVYLETALRLRPDDPGAHNDLGAVLRQRGRLDEAIAHLESAVRERPDAPMMQRNLGKALLEAGRRDDAIAHLQAALRLDPDDAEARRLLDAARAARGDAGKP